MTTYKSNPNVYQQITDRVIAAIEAGAPKFEMPWHRGSSHSRPVNVFTGKNYRGVNTVALWVAQMEYGYTTGTWGTYKQWKECGAQVLKGEHAATVVFFKDVERPVEDSEETKSKRSFVATASWVFNADQVEGYTASPVSSLVDKTQVLERVEAFITATDADITEKGNCACYNPIKDTIYMPKRELFTGSSTSSAVLTPIFWTLKSRYLKTPMIPFAVGATAARTQLGSDNPTRNESACSDPEKLDS